MLYYIQHSPRKASRVPRRVAQRLVNDRLHIVRCGRLGVSVLNDIVSVLIHCRLVVVWVLHELSEPCEHLVWLGDLVASIICYVRHL